MPTETTSRTRSGRTHQFKRTSLKANVLRALAKYYCLRTKDLAYILKSDDPEDNDTRTLNRTLKLLREEGLVCAKQIIQYGKTGRKFYPLVYGLKDKAVRELDEGRSFEERMTVEHELWLSQFHIDIEDLCEKMGWKLYWRQFDLKNGIDPDAYFRITTDKGGYHFFLEAERQRPGRSKKTAKKWAIYYDYYNSDRCMKEWKFKQFRVVIIEGSEERTTHLLNTLATVPLHWPSCKWYPPRNGKCDCTPRLANHRMFWVISEDQDITGKAFRTPKGDQYSFLDIQ
jgi:hypothetical protein